MVVPRMVTSLVVSLLALLGCQDKNNSIQRELYGLKLIFKLKNLTLSFIIGFPIVEVTIVGYVAFFAAVVTGLLILPFTFSLNLYLA